MAKSKPRPPMQLLQPGASLSPGEWFIYYAECRQFLLALGQKFANLFVQASVFAVAAAAAITAAAEKLHIYHPKNLLIALPSALGLAIYTVVTIYYFLQVRHAGIIMEAIEQDALRMTEDAGLLSHVRASKAAFFAHNWTLGLVILYLLAPICLVLGVARLSVPPAQDASHGTVGWLTLATGTVGIAQGQTLRLSVVNVGAMDAYVLCGFTMNPHPISLGECSVTLRPGESNDIGLKASELSKELFDKAARVQIWAFVRRRTRTVRGNLEVFENQTERTSIVVPLQESAHRE